MRSISRCGLLILVTLFFSIETSVAGTDFELLHRRVQFLENSQLTSDGLGIIEFNAAQDRYEIHFYPVDKLRTLLAIDAQSDCLENHYFRVVEFRVNAMNTRPRMLSDDCLSLRDFDGRNALYHLMKAARLFERLHGRNLTTALHRTIVRVRADRGWSRPDHVGLRTEYNNAYYFPRDIEGRWGEELWFYRSKQNFRWKTFLAQFGMAAFPKPGINLFLLPLLLRRNTDTGLDAAKVPSVIYHEAFHWAADQSGLLRASVFGQPMADAFCTYFAASLLGKPVVGGLDSFMDPKRTQKINELNVIGAKSPRPSRSDRAVDMMRYRRSPFIPSVFWHLRKELQGSAVDRIAWQTLAEMPESHSFTGLPHAIRNAAKKTLSDPDELHFVDNLLSREVVIRSFEYLDALFGSE